MGPAALVLAWLLSSAPLVLERAGWLDLSGGWGTPRVAVIALVWIALAGMPRAGIRAFELRTWWGTCMVFLPVLALGFALDSASGLGGMLNVVNAILALVLVALAALAADLARRRSRAHALHAVIWLAGVVGMPLFSAALSWGARSDGSIAPDWIQATARFSPLQWSVDSLVARAEPFVAIAALAASIAIAAIAALTSRGEIL